MADSWWTMRCWQCQMAYRKPPVGDATSYHPFLGHRVSFHWPSRSGAVCGRAHQVVLPNSEGDSLKSRCRFLVALWTENEPGKRWDLSCGSPYFGNIWRGYERILSCISFPLWFEAVPEFDPKHCSSCLFVELLPKGDLGVELMAHQPFWDVAIQIWGTNRI